MALSKGDDKSIIDKSLICCYKENLMSRGNLWIKIKVVFSRLLMLIQDNILRLSTPKLRKYLFVTY
jgi:hypothetical protein